MNENLHHYWRESDLEMERRLLYAKGGPERHFVSSDSSDDKLVEKKPVEGKGIGAPPEEPAYELYGGEPKPPKKLDIDPKDSPEKDKKPDRPYGGKRGKPTDKPRGGGGDGTPERHKVGTGKLTTGPRPGTTTEPGSKEEEGPDGLEAKMRFDMKPDESERIYKKTKEGEYELDENGQKIIIENDADTQRSMTSSVFQNRIKSMFDEHYRSNEREYFYNVLPKHIKAAKSELQRNDLQNEFKSYGKELSEIISGYMGLLSSITKTIFDTPEFQRGLVDYYSAYSKAWNLYYEGGKGGPGLNSLVSDRVAKKVFKRSGFMQSEGKAPGVYHGDQGLIGLSSIVDPEFGYSKGSSKRTEEARQKKGFLPKKEQERRRYEKEINRAEKAYGPTVRHNWENTHGRALEGLSGSALTDAKNKQNRDGLDSNSYSHAWLRERTGPSDEQIAIGRGAPIERLEWPPDDDMNRDTILAVDQRYRGAVMNSMNEELDLGFVEQKDFASNDKISFEEKQPASEDGFAQVIEYTRYDGWLDGNVVNPREGFVVTFQRKPKPGISEEQQEKECREDVHIVDKAKADEMYENLLNNPWYRAGRFSKAEPLIKQAGGILPEKRDFTLYSSADFIELYERHYPEVKAAVEGIQEAGNFMGDEEGLYKALLDFTKPDAARWGEQYPWVQRADNARVTFVDRLQKLGLEDDPAVAAVLKDIIGKDWLVEKESVKNRLRATAAIEGMPLVKGKKVRDYVTTLDQYSTWDAPTKKELHNAMLGHLDDNVVECLKYYAKGNYGKVETDIVKDWQSMQNRLMLLEAPTIEALQNLEKYDTWDPAKQNLFLMGVKKAVHTDPDLVSAYIPTPADKEDWNRVFEAKCDLNPAAWAKLKVDLVARAY